MALLTDKQTEKDLCERLDEFLQFGMVFNYMLEIDKIDVSDLEGMFFDSDQEKATIIYSTLLKKIDSSDIENSYSLYSNQYPNEGNLDSEGYNFYLNSNCVRQIIDAITTQKRPLDRTYINTYNYLLNDEGYARK